MEDLNDIYYFTSVVEHDGFSAAARAIGIEKTRLSRHVSNLETRLGVRLLQRSTRRIALTEAGQAFYERSQLIVESAKAAYDSVQQLKKEPAGSVRVLCPVVLAQSYLAPILPGYMAAHPKVTVFIEASDRMANPADERFDLALRARPDIEDSSGLVAREVGRARRILVASPDFLNRHGRPRQPDELSNVNILSNATDVHEGAARWLLTGSEQQLTRLQLRPMESGSRFCLSQLRSGLCRTARWNRSFRAGTRRTTSFIWSIRRPGACFPRFAASSTIC